MGRQEWITVGLTLFSVWLTWYLGQSKAAVLCGIIGALILVVMIFTRRGKQVPVPAQASQTVNPVITQTANPVVNVNVGNQSRPSEPALPVPPPKPKPKSNIKFVEAQSVEAHQGISDSRLYVSPSGLGDFCLAVVCFRNDALVGQAVAEPKLKAHIIYRDRDGKEVADSAAGVWIGQYGATAVFAVGHKQCLAIFLLSRQGTLMKVWSETYTTEQSWMSGGPLSRIGQEGLSQNFGSVSVSLLAEETCILRAEFDVEKRRNNELPKLVLRSIVEG